MQQHKGSSLLEIMLVLAVFSILVIVAVRYYTVVDLNRRVAEVMSKIDIVSRASYEWRSAERQMDFSEISNDELLTLGLVSATDLRNPWGGVIVVGSGEDQNHVRITVSHLGVGACRALRHHLQAIAYAEINQKACRTGSYYGEF